MENARTAAAREVWELWALSGRVVGLGCGGESGQVSWEPQKRRSGERLGGSQAGSTSKP